MHERDPNQRSDSDFEPGQLSHLTTGKVGRFLDTRRTPMRITRVDVQTGCFFAEITKFEDKGAIWELPFEQVEGAQFEPGEPLATEAQVIAYRRTIERLDGDFEISCTAEALKRTHARVAERVGECTDWMQRNSRFLAQGAELPSTNDTRRGSELAFDDVQRFMADRDLWDIEERFAVQFVSNPYSGELVKGHRMVLAELGLVPFVGKVLRDPKTFDGPNDKSTRAEHIISRLAFVQALFTAAEHTHVTLYRGVQCHGPLRPRKNSSFISSTFSRSIAESFFDSGYPEHTAVLYRQSVPVERLFMTYVETEPMNRQYMEAEAVLLAHTDNLAF